MSVLFSVEAIKPSVSNSPEIDLTEQYKNMRGGTEQGKPNNS